MPLSKDRRCPHCSKKISGSYCQWCGYLIKRDSPVRQKGAEQTDEPTVEEVGEGARHEMKAPAKVTKERAKKETEEEAAHIIADARRQAKQIIAHAKDRTRTRAKEESGGIIIKARNKVRERSSSFIAEVKDKVGLIIKGAKADTSKAEQVVAKTRKETKGEAQAIIKENRGRIVTTGKMIMVAGQFMKEAKQKMTKEAEHTVNQTGKKTEAALVNPLTVRRSQASKLYEGKVKLEIASPTELAQLMKFEEHLRQVPSLVVVYVGGSDAGTEIVVSTEKPIPLVRVLKGMPPVKRVVAEDIIEVTLRSSRYSR